MVSIRVIDRPHVQEKHRANIVDGPEVKSPTSPAHGGGVDHNPDASRKAVLPGPKSPFFNRNAMS
jgi:hypothetical protein